MSWTGWKVLDGPDVVVFAGFKANINVDESSGWVHYLVTPPDEEDPDENHIHIKCDMRTGEYVVASVKVDGIREVNRRELIEAVNKETGLDLQY